MSSHVYKEVEYHQATKNAFCNTFAHWPLRNSGGVMTLGKYALLCQAARIGHESTTSLVPRGENRLQGAKQSHFSIQVSTFNTVLYMYQSPDSRLKNDKSYP